MKPTLIFLGVLFSCSCTEKDDKIIASEELAEESDAIVLQQEKESENEEISRKEIRNLDCNYNQLSDQFNIKFSLEFINEDTSNIYVTIMNKKSDVVIDAINVESRWLISPPMFGSCEDVRSYSTGINLDKEIVDNCPGDLIIADLNFDSLDDFAIAVDNGGNGGYIYAFYLQTRNGKFVNDKFLSEEMLRFPVEFNKKAKTLTTSVHANAYENSETVYLLRNGKWQEIEEKLIKL